MAYEIKDVSANTSNQVNGPRAGVKPDGCLLHSTAGTNSLSWLQGGSAAAGTPASADFLIERTGLINQISPDNRYAYHAGTSVAYIAGNIYQNASVSRKLIGIEFEATTDQGPTYQQYDACGELIVVVLRPKYGWAWPFVLQGHYGVARPLNRRADPWLFDWGGFMGRLYYYAKQANIAGL